MSDMYDAEIQFRKRVEARMQARGDMYMHAAVFVLINILVWFLWVYLGTDIFPFPVVISLGWGAGFVAHAMEYYFKHGSWERRERIIQDEIVRARALLAKVKLKNGAGTVVGDDGELDLAPDHDIVDRPIVDPDSVNNFERLVD